MISRRGFLFSLPALTVAATTVKPIPSDRKFCWRCFTFKHCVHKIDFTRFAFPMVRAVFPNLVAMDLVTIQPMQGPSNSQIYYLDFKQNSYRVPA